MAMLAVSDRAALRDFLVAHFSMSELKDLIFDLGVGADVIAGDSTLDISRNLIEYCERRDKVACLLVEILKVRPNPDIERMCANTKGCAKEKKVEIIVHGAAPANLQEVLAEFAKKLKLSPDQLSLVAATTGSLKLLVSMPADAADDLLAMVPFQLADGKYQVSSAREFEALESAAKSTWKEVAQSDTPIRLPAAAIVATGMPGIIKLLLVVLALGAVGATGIVLAPALTIVNNCSIPVLLPGDLPIIHSIIPTGKSDYKLVPGDYSITQSGSQIRVIGPLGIDTGFFQPGGSFDITKDGAPVDLNRPISVSTGSHIQIEFCPGF